QQRPVPLDGADDGVELGALAAEGGQPLGVRRHLRPGEQRVDLVVAVEDLVEDAGVDHGRWRMGDGRWGARKPSAIFHPPSSNGRGRTARHTRTEGAPALPEHRPRLFVSYGMRTLLALLFAAAALPAAAQQPAIRVNGAAAEAADA